MSNETPNKRMMTVYIIYFILYNTFINKHIYSIHNI